MRYIFLSLLFAAALTAQSDRFSFGVKAGVPLTNAVPGDYGPFWMVDTGRWAIGPTVELRVAGSFSLELDALFRGYRTLGSYAYNQITIDGVTYPAFYATGRKDTKEWDVPLLLKYRFHAAGPVRPFVAAGEEFSYASTDTAEYTSCLNTTDFCNASLYRSQYTYNEKVIRGGPTAGVGVEFKYRKIKIAPEIRYTRRYQPKHNAVIFLVGFTF
jgi:hypothetical protein